ncbi:MAG: hypothetical protein GWN31_02540, partial [Candidatus Thorarchaeota archaeon]|nr:hypothetical protein [Candidatus Thorarchaeota archaeon]NIW12816.1 hypothetical protein [Candidatus Thorarchaeota archaeon]
TSIALDTLGRPITNTAILGAFAKVTGLIKLESLEKAVKKYFFGQLGTRNVEAIKRSYEQVKGPIKALVEAAPEEKTEITVSGYGVLRDVSSWRVFTPVIYEEKCISCKS